MKVKFFVRNSLVELEEIINKFISEKIEKPPYTVIQDIKFNSWNDAGHEESYHSAMIIYKLDPKQNKL